jgi:hypothetical protein
MPKPCRNDICSCAQTREYNEDKEVKVGRHRRLGGQAKGAVIYSFIRSFYASSLCTAMTG